MSPIVEPPKKTTEIDIDRIPVYKPRLPQIRPPQPGESQRRKRKIAGLFLLILFLAVGSLWFRPVNKPIVSKNSSPAKDHFHPSKMNAVATVPDMAYKPRAIPKKLSEDFVRHIEKTRAYIHEHINPRTQLARSLPGDTRLHNWSVVYDNAMRVIMHINLGDIDQAKKTIDYFIKSKAIRKTGWIKENGKIISKGEWIVNIVDAGEGRPGGRGIEHIAHVGPNAYLGIASLHLYGATDDRSYLDFARSQWETLKTVQNENPKDPNYGGIRMGPLGNPVDPREQKVSFNPENPSFYELYNGEHAADFKAFSNLMAFYDPANRDRYRQASQLISIWDKKIYNSRLHLFAIGTTEKKFFEENIGEWVKPGIIQMYPLDTNALKISAYGVDGLEVFENNAAEKIRGSIDKYFKVTVNSKNEEGKTIQLTGYDFVGSFDRKKLILFEETGPFNDIKVKKGIGREPLLSDEWSTWVAFADLRMAEYFEKKGELKKAEKYNSAYYENALVQGIKSGVYLKSGEIAYPYAHPLPNSLNKPVGFGWNTHHQPYSIIGGVARTLGLLRFDPFRVAGGQKAMDVAKKIIKTPVPFVRQSRNSNALYTEAEMYLKDAWAHVKKAELRKEDEEVEWENALKIVERMLQEHPDWPKVAETQNKIASNSEEKFPLLYQGGLGVRDLEPVFRQYWALYHIGTAEFIRIMAYDHLVFFANSRGETKKANSLQQKKLAAAERIYKKYFYSQGYDDSGWLWQPVVSLREFFDSGDLPEFDLRDLQQARG